MKYIIFLTILFNSLHSHQTGLSYVDIKQSDKNLINIVYKKPLEDTQADNINIRFPAQCRQISKSKKSIQNGYITEESSLMCGEKGLVGSRIWVEGLLSSDKGVMIRYENGSDIQSSLLRASNHFMKIGSKSTKTQIFTEYIKLGISHILMGFDHLLFVLCLILLVPDKKVLIYSVTAFTLSHSITLAAGILELATIPITYVESMIALSILFLAREYFHDKDDSFTKRNLALVAFIFGLLHGFGFSSVLNEIGIPKDETLIALFSFNAGVEIGQLIFIAMVISVYIMFKKLITTYQESIYKSIIYATGAASAFWFIERTLSF